MQITKENCHKMKGTEFTFIDYDGKTYSAYVAQCDPDVGFTIHDWYNDKPDSFNFLTCFAIHGWNNAKERHKRQFLSFLQTVEDYNKVVFAKAEGSNEMNYFGNCPF